MGTPLDPGPPLTPADEFCACEPPSRAEYLKASGASTLVVLGGALSWFGVVFTTGRLWGVTGILLGFVAGWAIHRAAGRHRSIMLGAMAAVATVQSTAYGYALLYLPFVNRPDGGWRVTWYELLMTALGAYVAYRLAGPRPQPKKRL